MPRWTQAQKDAAANKRAAKKAAFLKAVKPGDTLDIAPAVEAQKQQEIVIEADAKRIVAEISAIEAQPDFPKVERWGARGKLTISSPGTIVEDPTYIPEFVETHGGFKRRVCRHVVIDGQTVVLTADSQRKFRWCRKDDPTRISTHKRRGFRFSSYPALFDDTGLFEESTGTKHVVNGDLVLMEISMDGWERMRAEKKRLQAALEGSYGNELFAAGARSGVPTFKDDMKRGVREYMT